MAQITINNVFEKIRSICKECSFPTLPQKYAGVEDVQTLQIYMKTLEDIRVELGRFHRLEEEYLKLEKLLQREETELRRRVGVENELKLYVEALKQENEQLEREKLEFLENTKVHIKQLKKVNQNLFAELTAERNKNKIGNLETLEKSNKKLAKQKVGDVSKSLNRNKATKRQKSIKEIIKTEFIEREKFNTDTKRQRKVHHYKIHSSIMSEHEGDNHHLQDNLRTFQEYNPNTGRNIKNHPQELAKGNSHFVSNQTLSNFFDEGKVNTKRIIDREKIGKSPYRLEKRDAFTKTKAENLSRHQSRQRKHNRSVYSVLSAEQIQNQKELF